MEDIELQKQMISHPLRSITIIPVNTMIHAIKTSKRNLKQRALLEVWYPAFIHNHSRAYSFNKLKLPDCIYFFWWHKKQDEILQTIQIGGIARREVHTLSTEFCTNLTKCICLHSHLWLLESLYSISRSLSTTWDLCYWDSSFYNKCEPWNVGRNKF